ncbi:hypothetical protein L3C95_18625 [Chitinophaga filiformis]|uniref:hypothetical protein n=1 Tax=Chitinophaga filiformis TaxID=104663 RepID=UPI001F1B6192|nr:hypothetical protein [Chitinophaga filiformis]MCF6404922.1 hypothetical protein [Chitinophaga filiformis]
MKTLIKLFVVSGLSACLFTSCIKNAVKDISIKNETTDKSTISPPTILGTCDAENFYFFENGVEDPPFSFGVQINSTGWSSAIVGVKEYNSTGPFTNYPITTPTNNIVTIATGIDNLKTYDIQLTLTCSDGTISTSAIRHDQIKGYDVGTSPTNNVTVTTSSSPGSITVRNNFNFPIYVGLSQVINSMTVVISGPQQLAAGAQLSYPSLAASRYGVMLNKFETFPGQSAFTRFVTIR